MKKFILFIVTAAILCSVTVFARTITPTALKDDFRLEDTPYKVENLNCIESDYDTLADNKKITTWDGRWDVWMLSSSMNMNGYNYLEYNMVCSEPGKDGSLTYKGDFGGLIFSAVAMYSENLVNKLGGGDWFEWKPLYQNMPIKMYAGETEDTMTELEVNYFKTAAWYPESYLEYIVEELPENTSFVKVVIPGASEEDYKDIKLACVTVTDDNGLYKDAYVNPFIDFNADDACEVRLQKFFVNGIQTTQLDCGSIYGKTVINNCRSSSINATMFVCLYKNGEIVDIKSDNMTIAGYQNVLFSTESSPLLIPEGENPAEYSVKMWVLTDIGSIDSAVSIGDTEQVIPANINVKKYSEDFIHVLSPEYTNEISGDTVIKVYAPAFAGMNITLSCWKQNDTPKGEDFTAEITIDPQGFGQYVFHADEFPHGPLQLRLYGEDYDEWDEEYNARQMTNLQVYNIGGTPFQEGLGEYADSLVPDVAKGLKVVFEDDFTDGNLSIARWDSTKTYGSHKVGFGDYSGVYFRDFEDENLNSFSQFDTYMRIRADENKDSAGIISTLHQDGNGIAVLPPAYFECRMVAPYEKGTWPAIWFMTYNNEGKPVDEIDLLEAYGFDDYTEWAYKGFTTSIHEWGREQPTDPEWNAGQRGFTCDMNKIGDGTSWFVKPHTYGYYLGEEESAYFIDGEEIWRHPTWPASQQDPTYMMFNLAIGGSSGWPRDLSRYNGFADMYVDYIRIFGK